MATILLWQFDQYLKKHQIGAYNRDTVVEFGKLRELRKTLADQHTEERMKEAEQQQEECKETCNVEQANE